ncbi:DNA internalization-related competence protein ComEC/Rec2 [Shewanella donghaensis]|uniref:DNA internalization-related competence protein ComEC/Rec2 n=1 Tax=Shewanella donghaensis TaxID=238836 RepID=UPI0013155590|nr:DNA internalization-related competence protein ComEC/Rec2 [Shewanella donghaensis]
MPSLLPLWIVALLVVIGLFTLKKWPFISGVLYGVLWISLCFYSLFSKQESEIPVTIQFKAQIVSLVSKNSDWISFNVRLLSEQQSIYTRYYRLNWQKPPEVKVGQIWQFTARMKPITSPINQGGFNQQKYFLSQHIVGKGSVKSSQLIEYDKTIRQTVIDKVTPILMLSRHYAIIRALLFGDKSGITSMQWQTLRQTGTGHLVAISGLHLSVVFGLFWWFSRLILLNFFPVSNRRNLVVAVILAATVAMSYGYLAGLAISTQRALVMLMMIVLLTLFKQHASTWQRLIWALFAVVIIDPFASLSAGFWLSFSALSIILFTIDYVGFDSKQTNDAKKNNDVNQVVAADKSDHDNKSNSENSFSLAQFLSVKIMRFAEHISILLKNFWAIQWRLFLALGVIQALLFGTISIHSIWINFLMVPWFSIVVIPLCICTLVIGILLLPIPQIISLPITTTMLRLTDLSLDPFQALLSSSSELPFNQFHISDEFTLGLLMFIMGIFLIKWAVNNHWRVCFAILCLPLMLQLLSLFNVDTTSTKQAAWKMHILDVGQGMAVLLQQGHRGVLYDTGAAYGDSFSYAQRVIIPTLIAKGVTDLDYLMISHDDNDHSGGVNAILAQFDDVTLVSNLPEFNQQGVDSIECDTGQFNWMNLNISITSNPLATSDNNQSCIAYINDGVNRVLLAGDIEKKTEQYLVNTGEIMDADILLVPHHGSRTSSSVLFIETVNPEVAIFTAGFANQYGFPKNDVLQRYQQRGVKTLVSGQSGQISIDFTQAGYQIRLYRTDIAPFWYNALFRFGEKVKAE